MHRWAITYVYVASKVSYIFSEINGVSFQLTYLYIYFWVYVKRMKYNVQKLIDRDVAKKRMKTR